MNLTAEWVRLFVDTAPEPPVFGAENIAWNC